MHSLAEAKRYLVFEKKVGRWVITNCVFQVLFLLSDFLKTKVQFWKIWEGRVTIRVDNEGWAIPKSKEEGKSWPCRSTEVACRYLFERLSATQAEECGEHFNILVSLIPLTRFRVSCICYFGNALEPEEKNISGNQLDASDVKGFLSLRISHIVLCRGAVS